MRAVIDFRSARAAAMPIHRFIAAAVAVLCCISGGPAEASLRSKLF